MSPEPPAPPERVRRIIITVMDNGTGSFALENIDPIEGLGILLHTAIRISMMTPTRGA